MANRAPITERQEELLGKLEQLAAERARIERSYIATILACKVAGATQAEIARRAGVSAEAIRQTVTRHRD